MMYYAYKGDYELGKEPLGSDGRLLIKDLKTDRGAVRRCKRYLGETFRLYRYSNFYDDKTFKEVKQRGKETRNLKWFRVSLFRRSIK